MTYRSHIDGLRAVAVLLVIAFHFTLQVRGGFIGVDVFFVISGFLISTLIFAGLDADRFSIATFYVRRIRRIVPALTIVLLATSVAGALVLLPSMYRDYGSSLLAATLSVSNVLFSREGGYFSELDANKPLLHTWSLAVEEQFYLVFPICLALLYAYARKHRLLVVGMATLFSLAASAFMTYHDRSSAFFFAPYRAWELFTGCLVALVIAKWPARRLVDESMGVAGVVLIAGSAILLTGRIPFPGLAAVPACAGAAFVISSGVGRTTFVSRLLSAPPLVFVGRLSYSLYLWHWPMLVLLRQRLLEPEPGKVARVGALATTFALSWLSWRFIERPFRERTSSNRAVWFGFASVVTVLVTVGLIISKTNGLPARFDTETVRLASYLDYPDSSIFGTQHCYVTPVDNFVRFNRTGCLRRSASRPNVLLIGDSHAAHLDYGLRTVLGDVNFMSVGGTGCKPVLRPSEPGQSAECRKLFDYLFQQFIPANPPDLLLISARWSDRDGPSLGETLDWSRAKGVRVLVLGPIVEYRLALPVLAAWAQQRGDPGLVGRNATPGVAALDRRLGELVVEHKALYGSTYRAICPDGQCLEQTADHAPVQFDYGHLTMEGSVLVARHLVSGFPSITRAASP